MKSDITLHSKIIFNFQFSFLLCNNLDSIWTWHVLIFFRKFWLHNICQILWRIFQVKYEETWTLPFRNSAVQWLASLKSPAILMFLLNFTSPTMNYIRRRTSRSCTESHDYQILEWKQSVNYSPISASYPMDFWL